MPRHTVAVLVAAVMSTAAVAAHASVSSLPGRNGEILFGVDWPTHLQFGGTDPKGVLVEGCGLEPGRAGRRWTIGSPGMLALDAAAAPAGTPVAVTVVGTGAYLALVSPRHLRPVRLRDGGSASWSPDGGSLAFAASTSPTAPHSAEIFVLDLATGSARQLTAGGGYAIQPRWSPDGTQIAFTSTRTGSNQVYTMAANGSDVRQLTAPPGESGDPDWSPDGGRIVFASDRSGSERLYTMRTAPAWRRSAAGSRAPRRSGRPTGASSPSPRTSTCTSSPSTGAATGSPTPARSRAARATGRRSRRRRYQRGRVASGGQDRTEAAS